MNITRTRLCILIGLILLTSCLVSTAAESDWGFDSDRGSLTKYAGPGGDVAVPSEIAGVPVRKLETSLLNNNPDIRSVQIPEGVVHIGGSVCAWNKNLGRVQLPNSLLVIEDGCLTSNPLLEELVIPPAVCWVGDGCFGFNDSLRSIAFTGPCPEFRGGCLAAVPDDVVVTVPDDEYDAYQAALTRAGCRLTIQRSGQNAIRPEPVYDTENLVFEAETGTVTGYSGRAVRLDIPETINGAPVKAIGQGAFEKHPTLCYVSLPEGVTTIGEKAFSFLQTLHFVKLPSTLTAIGSKAFEGAYRIGTLVLPDGLTTIGSEAFTYCTVRGEILFPASLQSIGEKAFAECAWLNKLNIPSSVAEIGDNAFEDCGISYIYMDGLTPPKLGANVFIECDSLKDIDLNHKCTKQQAQEMQAYVDALGLSCRVWRNQNPDVSYTAKGTATYTDAPDGTMLFAGYTGEAPNIRPYDVYNDKKVTGISDGALRGNTVVTYFSVPYNDMFSTIGAEAFADSALEQVDLFDSVTSIGAGAFKNCVRLKELTLPESVTSIGSEAFAGCTGLQKVTLLCDPAVLPENAFAGCQIAELRVRDNATDNEIAALSERFGLPWHHPVLRLSQQSTFQTMPFTPTDESLFDFDASTGTITAYKGKEVDVVIPGSIGGVPVTALAYGVFDSAYDYTNTEMMSNRENWLPLRSVVIPETVVSLSDSLFNYCQQLETVVCYAPLETTARNTFNLCRSLKTVVFVNGIRTLDNYAFQDTESLETVYTGRHLDRIGVSAFLRSGITAYTVDADTVDADAFRDCPNLEELRFTAQCKTVTAGTVNNCPNLKTICYEGTDLGFIPNDGIVFGAKNDLTVRVQEGLSEDAMNRARRTLCWAQNNPALNIEPGVWADEANAMPDINALLGASQTTPASLPAGQPATAQPTEIPAAPVPVGDEGAPFFGDWYGISMTEGGQTYTLQELGMAFRLIFHKDGTAQFISPDGEADQDTWTVQDGKARIQSMTLTIREDGTLSMAEDGSEMIFGREKPEAPASEPAPEPAVEPTPEPAVESTAAPTAMPAPSTAASSADYLEKKYVCTSAEVGGYAVQAAMLGGEYSIVFHENGTADFMIAGQPMPPLNWIIKKARNAAGEETDALVVDYLGSAELCFIPTEKGFDLNYFDSMQMKYEHKD